MKYLIHLNSTSRPQFLATNLSPFIFLQHIPFHLSSNTSHAYISGTLYNPELNETSIPYPLHSSSPHAFLLLLDNTSFPNTHVTRAILHLSLYTSTSLTHQHTPHPSLSPLTHTINSSRSLASSHPLVISLPTYDLQLLALLSPREIP